MGNRVWAGWGSGRTFIVGETILHISDVHIDDRPRLAIKCCFAKPQKPITSSVEDKSTKPPTNQPTTPLVITNCAIHCK